MAEASGLAGVGCTAIQAVEAADALGRWSGQVGIEVEDGGGRAVPGKCPGAHDWAEVWMGANCALWTGDIKLQLVSKRRNQKQLHCCIRKTKVSRQHAVVLRPCC